MNSRKSVQEILNADTTRERRQWLASATIPELQEFLRSMSAGNNEYHYARTELDARLAEAALEPHWSVVPTFWIVLVTALLTAVSIIIALLR